MIIRLSELRVVMVRYYESKAVWEKAIVRLGEENQRLGERGLSV